jgi:hypothetical protein
VDVPTILDYLNDANWVDIFGTSDANTYVSLFYDKLERSFASKTVLSVIRSDFLIMLTSSIRYDGSVGDCPAEICGLFADLFESVYKVVTRILKICLAHSMVVISAAFGFACPI